MLVIPMIFLSGALYPVSDLPTWLGVLNRLNPLTYAVDPMRRLVFDRLDVSESARHALAPGVTWWGWPVPAFVEVGFVLALGLAMLGVAIFRFTRNGMTHRHAVRNAGRTTSPDGHISPSIGVICCIGVSPGVVSPGTAPGTVSTSTPRARRTAAVPNEATRRHGTVFSIAMRPATTAIHVTLMIPSAKSEAMRAQQQPTHQAPFPAPIRSAPDGPSRHEPSSVPSGLRHLPRQTSFNGVSSYTAATTSVPRPSTGRPGPT